MDLKKGKQEKKGTLVDNCNVFPDSFVGKPS